MKREVPRSAMLDFIFIIGPSGVGKTTLAARLYKQLGGVYIEQNAVPEFEIPAYVKDIGVYEEQVCWGCVLRQAEYFHSLGRHNIVILDFDDLRAREIPLLFKGHRYIIIRLYSSDPEQLRAQMAHRRDNEGGLYAPQGIAEVNERISSRPLLPNEVKTDVAGKDREQVLSEVLGIINGFEPQLDYEYELCGTDGYLSWVHSRELGWELICK